jgi:hypothetical protein
MAFFGFRPSDHAHRTRTSRDLRPAVEGFESRRLLSTAAGVAAFDGQAASLASLRKHAPQVATPEIKHAPQVATPEIKHGWHDGAMATPEIKHGNGPI